MRRQGRLDAHRRSVQGHDGRERHRRRRPAPDLRRSADRQDLEDRRGRDRVRRRRRLQSGHHAREHEPRQGLEPAGDLRVRGQRLRRVHGQLLGVRGRPGRARQGLWPALAPGRRPRLLRGVGRRARGDRAGARWRRAERAARQVHALLRPFRGRRHDLSGARRDRQAEGGEGLPRAVPSAGHRGRPARGPPARPDRQGGAPGHRSGAGRRPRRRGRRPRPIS